MVKVYFWHRQGRNVQSFDSLEAAMQAARSWEYDQYCFVKWIVDADGREYDEEAIRQWREDNPTIPEPTYETFHDEQWEVV